MEQEKKKKFIWILAIILVILIILWWAFRTSDQGIFNVNQNNDNQAPEFKPPSINLEYKEPAIPVQTNTEFTIINLAKSFAARFGSWSTDNQGHNLEELLPLSTNRMQTYLNSIEMNESEEFSGTTTKSLSAKILSSDDNSATVLVGTQRIETRADLSTNIFYQDIEIKVLKSADIWLVDEANWQ